MTLPDGPHRDDALSRVLNRTASPIRSAGAEPPLLSVQGLSMRFGGIIALDNVSFDVAQGRICGLIGPNGAGKTTLFNCLSRLYEPLTGAIYFDGRSLAGVATHEIAKLGIGRTFQNLALFGTMTVLENVMIGTHSTARGGFAVNALGLAVARRQEAVIRERAIRLVEEFALTRLAGETVNALPFGTRKRVELARALAAEPKLLLLDEPAAGLNHEEVDALRKEIQSIRDRRGVTVLLVEHHMNLVMRVSDKVVALDFGRVIADGAPAEVRENPDLIRAYLGDAA